VGAVLSITSLAQNLHKPPSHCYAPFTTDKGVLPQRLPPSSFLNLHCCRRPICCSTLLQLGSISLSLLCTSFLMSCKFTASPYEFHRYSGPKTLLQLSTFPNKAHSISLCPIAHAQFTCRCILLLFGCVRGAYRKELLQRKQCHSVREVAR